MAEYWSRSFFVRVYGPRYLHVYPSWSVNMQKKNAVFLRHTASCSEWARDRHVVRSGSQSQRRIQLILPAHGASHKKSLV